MAAFVPTEDRPQFATLIVAGGFVDVYTEGTAAREEVARPFAGDDNLRTPQVDAVRVTLSDVEREGASAPALVHLTLGSQPAGAKHFAVTQLKTLSANVPGHC